MQKGLSLRQMDFQAGLAGHLPVKDFIEFVEEWTG